MMEYACTYSLLVNHSISDEKGNLFQSKYILQKIKKIQKINKAIYIVFIPAIFIKEK